jgi:hypothetical protein
MKSDSVSASSEEICEVTVEGSVDAVDDVMSDISLMDSFERVLSNRGWPLPAGRALGDATGVGPVLQVFGVLDRDDAERRLGDGGAELRGDPIGSGTPAFHLRISVERTLARHFSLQKTRSFLQKTEALAGLIGSSHVKQ